MRSSPRLPPWPRLRGPLRGDPALPPAGSPTLGPWLPQHRRGHPALQASVSPLQIQAPRGPSPHHPASPGPSVGPTFLWNEAWALSPDPRPQRTPRSLCRPARSSAAPYTLHVPIQTAAWSRPGALLVTP